MNKKTEGTVKRRLTWLISLSLLMALALVALGYNYKSSVTAASEKEPPTQVDIAAVAADAAAGAKSSYAKTVSVTIFGSSSLDASMLTPSSLSFKDAQTLEGAIGANSVSLKDVNQDNYPDLTVEFLLSRINEQPTKMLLEGRTDGGTLVQGSTCLQASGAPCGGTTIEVNEAQSGNGASPAVPKGASCGENFDGVTAPALPVNWVAATAIDCVNSNPWETSAAGTPSPPADTAPNAAFANDPNCISDERLNSPSFPIVSTAAVLTFRQNRNLENNFDGTVLEVSINGGAFQDILAAGGSFGGGGYNGTISVNFGSPIAGRQAWTGNSSGFVTTTVNLPASANGQSWVFRWRRATDSSVSGQGFRLDGVVLSGSDCSGAACTITCPANVTQGNDPGQCGAVVNYPAPTTTGTCGTVTCSPASASFFPVGTTTVTCTTSGPSCSFTVTVNDTQPPTITCPANVTQSNDPNQCGAVVNYPPPTASDNCPGVGTPVCSPASGSFFPVGTTTVTCNTTDAAGNTATCSFTVTVVDTQPPTITCPPNQTVVANQTQCAVAGGCVVATFPDPVATDNCPGVTVACNPPSGSCFPIGVTTVTCTATDGSGNTATCSFTITVFDVALQDDSDPSIVLLWNSITGQYRFCCKGTTYTGIGKSTVQGCVFTLQHNPADRRVLGRVDKAVHAGTASIQAPAGTLRCTITDRNTLNDTPTCQ